MGESVVGPHEPTLRRTSVGFSWDGAGRHVIALGNMMERP